MLVTQVQRTFETFVGIDLGGARGKTTAVAHLRREHVAEDASEISVHAVSTRGSGREPWHDDALFDYLAALPGPAVVAVNAPLTVPACVRCVRPVCPGKAACEEPAVVWLENQGQALIARADQADRNRIAAVRGGVSSMASTVKAPRSSARLEPYVHRCCEVVMHYEQGVLPRGSLGMATGPIAARAAHLRRRLAGLGYRLDHDLLEVHARTTVHALFGARHARAYRRDADPWEVRADIIERLSPPLRFASSSRMAREDVLSNDHCFDALISGYTAYLWARDGWTQPTDHAFHTDGWIWAPPDRG